MAIIHWSQSGKLRLPSIFDEDFWPEFPTQGIHGLNNYETEDASIAEAAVTGIPEDKIDVSVRDNVVRITGAVEEKFEEKIKTATILRQKPQALTMLLRFLKGASKRNPKQNHKKAS